MVVVVVVVRFPLAAGEEEDDEDEVDWLISCLEREKNRLITEHTHTHAKQTREASVYQ